jgi:hypothetical protein
VTVQQVHMAIGQWGIQLTNDAPPGVVSSLAAYGHVAVVRGRVNPVEHGDDIIGLADYVGVLRKVAGDPGSGVALSGPGMAVWLGDEEDKGDILESPGVGLDADTFADSIRALLPASGAITEGTIYSGVSGTYSGLHMYQTPRKAIDYVCETMGGEWRVNHDGTLDAGPASSLFTATPTCVIVRRDIAGHDMDLRAIPGALKAEVDAADYATRVVLVAQALAGGTAGPGTVPYKDIHGNEAVWTYVVDETDDTWYSNAAARAAAILSDRSTLRQAVTLDRVDYDVQGTFEAGDTVWVWDPTIGLVDTGNEVNFRGRLLNPVAVRVLSITWPVTEGMTVAYRDADGAWTDLTPWIRWESADGGQVEVADRAAATLTGGGTSGTIVPGSGGGYGDLAVPGVPTFGAFATGTYQGGDGLPRAYVQVTWSEPNNTDGSSIVDGDYYQIRYRATGSASDWQYAVVGFSETSFVVNELSPNTQYDWAIRAVDYATPRNYGAWSGTTQYTAQQDTTAPSTPAAPAVAASLIAVQVTHTLGKATGGTYNLELDLDHLEVHVGTTSGFTPDSASLVGKLPANSGMITGTVAAVGTFPVDTIVSAGSAAYVKVVAVDRAGNASTASSAASETADLIDNAHITSLTASKITAGTISTALLLSGSIKTGTSGARVEIDANGVRLYNSSGTNTVDLDATSGDVSITGTISTDLTGRRIIIDGQSGPLGVSTIYFYPTSGSDYAWINSFSDGLVEVSSTTAGTTRTRMYTDDTSAALESLKSSNDAHYGGSVYLDSTSASIRNYDSSGTQQGAIILGTYLRAYGRWDDWTDLGAYQGIMTGRVTISSGYAGVVISLGTTKATSMWPIVTTHSTTSPNAYYWVTALNTSSFTVTWSAAFSVTSAVAFWIPRC